MFVYGTLQTIVQISPYSFICLSSNLHSEYTRIELVHETNTTDTPKMIIYPNDHLSKFVNI